MSKTLQGNRAWSAINCRKNHLEVLSLICHVKVQMKLGQVVKEMSVPSVSSQRCFCLPQLPVENPNLNSNEEQVPSQNSACFDPTNPIHTSPGLPAPGSCCNSSWLCSIPGASPQNFRVSLQSQLNWGWEHPKSSVLYCGRVKPDTTDTQDINSGEDTNKKSKKWRESRPIAHF